jgi:chromosome segregation ATPase
MRFKLEEEYMQNAKNHEEEVHLRMKFESKLNEMHGDLRDVNTRYARCQIELSEAVSRAEELNLALGEKTAEITKLNQDIVELKNRMGTQTEKLNSLDREITVKGNQVAEFKERVEAAADEYEL